MDLDAYEVGYFITQVGLSAASFGVATEDVEAVGHALAALFDYRCAPPTVVIPSQPADLQSICLADNCPVAANATCSSYPAEMSAAPANATNMYNSTTNSTSGSSGSGSSSASSSASAAMQTTNAGSHVAVEGIMAVVGAAALAFAL